MLTRNSLGIKCDFTLLLTTLFLIIFSSWNEIQSLIHSVLFYQEINFKKCFNYFNKILVKKKSYNLNYKRFVSCKKKTYKNAEKEIVLIKTSSIFSLKYTITISKYN